MSSKRVRYVGSHDAVDVPMPDGRMEVVKFRGHLETTAAHAKQLLEQEENWREVEPPAPKKDEAPAKADAKSADAKEKS
jgi:hypothetical protein